MRLQKLAIAVAVITALSACSDDDDKTKTSQKDKANTFSDFVYLPIYMVDNITELSFVGLLNKRLTLPERQLVLNAQMQK